MRRLARKAAPWLWAGPAILALGGCATPGSSFLDPGGIVAAFQRQWLVEILLALIIVVLPVFIGVPYCLWRFRRGGGGDYRPDWSFSKPLEFFVWGVPCVVVFVLSLLVTGPESRFSPYAPLSNETPVHVQVVALNWKFLFIYPDFHVASVDRLVIPVGQAVRFELTSDATMQSFSIPALGSQIYAMAGMITQLNLRADRSGHFAGENTQFNGMGFQGQHFDCEAMSAAGFDAWIAQLRQQPALNAPSYARLKRDGSNEDAAHAFPDASTLTGLPSFSAVPESFFHEIVSRYSPTGQDMNQ